MKRKTTNTIKSGKIIKTVLLVLIMASAITATYFTTKHYVFREAYQNAINAGYKYGYTKGHDVGYQKGWGDSQKLSDTGTGQCDSTPTANDPLGCLPQSKQTSTQNTYNTYQAPQAAPTNNSIHCTTSTPYYSRTTYTDCN